MHPIATLRVISSFAFTEIFMDLIEINDTLLEYRPDNLILQSFQARDRKLCIAFTCDGGEREDFAYIVEFTHAVCFHVPSVLYVPIQFRVSDAKLAKNYIPSISLDESEFGEKGLKLVLLCNEKALPVGYYIAAESVLSEWVSREKCDFVW